MPATCFICTETLTTLEAAVIRLGLGVNRTLHGDSADGTWCSPRQYRLASPPPSGDRTYRRYGPGGSAELFNALPRVGTTCPSCGVGAGKYHHLNCASEICPRHGTALVSCGCALCLLFPLLAANPPGIHYRSGYHPADWGGVNP